MMTMRTGTTTRVTAVSNILKKRNTFLDDDELSVLLFTALALSSTASVGNRTIICTMKAAMMRQPMIILALRMVQSFDRLSG